MKSFVHPKLRRKTREGEFLGYGNTIHYEIGKTLSDKIVFWSKPHTYTEQELLALGFEEVVEEKEIPKAKKLTVKEITDYYGKIQEGLDEWVVKHNKENKIDVLITSAIVGFLRDHDLLEE